MAKAFKMGVIKGADGKMSPNSAITRQEVFVIIARAFKLQPASTSAIAFTDVGSIADWAKGEVFALVNAGYIKGSEGKLNPEGLITRAEFAQTFDNIIKQYISKSGQVTAVESGNIMVNQPGVTLKNLTISGDLIIGDGVGDGELTLDSVKVTGRIVVRGGGVNSIIIRGSSEASSVVVARVDGAVSVKVQGNANVEVIYIDDGSDDVNIEGTVGNIQVEAADVVVTAVGATIKSLDILGGNSKIVVDKNSKVEKVDVQKGAAKVNLEVAGTVTTVTTSGADTVVAGTGKVEQVEARAGASGAKIETPNTQIAVGAGVSGVTGGGGKGIESGSTVTNSSNGGDIKTPTAPPSGGGDGDSTVYVEEIKVTGAASVAVDRSIQMTATATPLTAPNKSVAWSVLSSGTDTIATINQNGMLTGVSPGTVLVKATALDGSLKYATLVVTVHEAIYNATKKIGFDTINAALEAEKTTNGDTITIAEGTYELSQQLNISKKLTISGTGSVTIKAVGTWPTDNSNKHLLNISVGNQNEKVTLSNITFDSNGKAFGIQAYGNAYAELKDVTIKNSLGAGLTVNGSTIIADNLNTSDNLWGAVNVDPGKNVITDSRFELTGGVLSEDIKQIWSDGANVNGAAEVFVTADGYTLFKQDGNEKYLLWFNKTPKNYATISGNTESYYANIQAAIDDANAGDVITLAEGIYEVTNQINITEPLTLIGAGSVTIKAKGTWSPDSDKKHILDIYAGTTTEKVTLSNITFDSSGIAFGLQGVRKRLWRTE